MISVKIRVGVSVGFERRLGLRQVLGISHGLHGILCGTLDVNFKS